MAPLTRLSSLVMTAFVVAVSVLVLPQPALASSSASSTSTAVVARADLCSVDEWKVDPTGCIERLPEVANSTFTCLNPPSPDAPDAGIGGWFAERTDQTGKTGIAGKYTDNGYAGYTSYTTYDLGNCAQEVLNPQYKFENTVANGEFMAAVTVIGASNALRDRAWNPKAMWSWADPLLETATKSLYTQVFSVFGVITLAVVGVYLLWRSRQAQMSMATTTVAWAVFVMVLVTALATWPTQSTRFADAALIKSLGTVHDVVGPRDQSVPEGQCLLPDPDACVDHRSSALRASDTAVDTMLYRNWLRGVLGSADSPTAQKYGYSLYLARTFTWEELADARSDPALRDQIITSKKQQWTRIAEQIKVEDPAAYQYLQGTKGMERIGAGFIAMLAAVLYAAFDLTASLLVLLGFLIFRWAIVAAPIIGTVAIMRPASAGFRRLMHTVVAALFNILVFGVGAGIYLFAVDLIMNSELPGWLQVVLVGLSGVVGWMLLRPYRRITQLGGKDPIAAIAAGGLFHRRAAHQAEAAALAAAAATSDGRVPAVGDRPTLRIEGSSFDGVRDGTAVPAPQRSESEPARGEGWREPAEARPGFALYRPGRSSTTAAAQQPEWGSRVEASTE